MSFANTDIVSVSGIHLTATVGPDHWHRTRPQPVYVSVQLHLAQSYLDTPAQSDDVADSLHYGHLSKAVERCVMKARAGEDSKQSEGGRLAGQYASARALAEDVTEAAFMFVRNATAGRNPGPDASLSGDGKGEEEEKEKEVPVRAVRVVVELPKQILLARAFEVELNTPVVPSAGRWTASESPSGTAAARSLKAEGMIVRVRDLDLPVLIGVNPPERLAKQRVITHLTFFEAAQQQQEQMTTMPPSTASEEQQLAMRRDELCETQIDYPAIIQRIVTEVECSSYLTLEKLVYEIIRTAYRTSDDARHPNRYRIQAITVRCQKPSALSFAEASEVEMTRTREEIDT